MKLHMLNISGRVTMCGRNSLNFNRRDEDFTHNVLEVTCATCKRMLEPVEATNEAVDVARTPLSVLPQLASKMLRVLERVEWSGKMRCGFSTCPSCGGSWNAKEHVAGCELRQLLISLKAAGVKP